MHGMLASTANRKDVAAATRNGSTNFRVLEKYGSVSKETHRSNAGDDTKEVQE